MASAGIGGGAGPIASETVPDGEISQHRSLLPHLDPLADHHPADEGEEEPVPVPRLEPLDTDDPRTAPTTTPPHPATLRATNRSFVMPQTTASNMRPPSTGNPGQRVETREEQAEERQVPQDGREDAFGSLGSEPEDARRGPAC